MRKEEFSSFKKVLELKPRDVSEVDGWRYLKSPWWPSERTLPSKQYAPEENSIAYVEMDEKKFLVYIEFFVW
jgi:hypothetical protein